MGLVFFKVVLCKCGIVTLHREIVTVPHHEAQ